MYRGFKLEAIDFNSDSRTRLFNRGEAIFKDSNKEIRAKLKSFMFSDNSLDGSKIQDAWFPQINAQVFISHSHKDEVMAKMLAGWLKETFNIDSFIDSCVWGYANDLLRDIDNEFCINDNGLTYDYNKRNYSTSHVHMMLSSALSMMIDNTECLFFLNTENSITLSESIEKTESPWLYFEIGISQIIRTKERIRNLLERVRLYSSHDDLEKAIKVSYTTDTHHLTKIDTNTLNAWVDQNNKLLKGENALDTLYVLKPLPKTSNSLHS